MARFRIVLLRPEAETSEVPLRGRRIRIGRSQECDLVFASDRVSRHHARLSRAASGGYQVEDLGSAHGTEVNGERIRGARALVPGDVVSLADGEIALRYEQTTQAHPLARRRSQAIAVGACLLAAVGFWLARPRPPSSMLRAQSLVDQALTAHGRGDWLTARRELRSAAGILFQAGLLEGGDSGQPVRTALAMLGESRDVDLAAVLAEIDAALLSTPKRASRPTVSDRCRLDEADVRSMPRCLRVEVDFVLGELGESSTAVPDPWLPHIGRQLAERRRFYEAILARPNEVVPLLREELEAAGVSSLFHYLAFIESAYRSRAQSHAGAAGIWQFIPSTARRYRLEVNERVDQRRDPILATRAAAAYLLDLRAHFSDFEGSLLLAIAGYNYGEHKVERALRRLDNPFGASPYWELVETGLLPKETADYAPRFLAAAVAGESGLPSAETLRAAGYGLGG